jgi:hypothetical protein
MTWIELNLEARRGFNRGKRGGVKRVFNGQGSAGGSPSELDALGPFF